MSADAPRFTLATMFSLRRSLVALAAGLSVFLLVMPIWQSPRPQLFLRVIGVAVVLLVLFGVLERWPRQLPRRIARWVVQVFGVALAAPICYLVIYIASTAPGAPPFWQVEDRLGGFFLLTLPSMLLSMWVTLSAAIIHKDAIAKQQALAFQLERGRLQTEMSSARLRLLQAQVEPHFLFNTLANVQELVESGAPQASIVLRSLINYLRAAVPRLHADSCTVDEELRLVSAYLDVMHMRMPDRLQIDIRCAEPARGLPCPPMSILTLVENAVRHGIDPSVDGGRIEIDVAVRNSRCVVSVSDTGVGLTAGSRSLGAGLGTGLATLRERLRLAFDGESEVTLSEMQPRGTRARMEFPARADVAQATATH